MDIEIRKLLKKDREDFVEILKQIPQFTEEEKECAVELIDDNLDNGEESDYKFIVAVDGKDKGLGYICFGKISLTDACYDIYWIVVAPKCQAKGIGSRLISSLETELKEMGARKIFIETSSMEQYTATQGFYQKNDFKLVTYIKDFFKIGDGKLIYMKNIERSGENG